MTTERTNQAGVGLPVGTRIGKYEVRERIAIGGQAIVYKCYDELLDRHVAIKQISTHLAEDPKFLERFRREAQILARLGAEEPAIVTIHELVQDERGLFLVMEFVEGHTLETVLRDSDGPVESKAVLKILWRLAAALHAVHAAGIIHRDIKPGNIIVCEGLRPKITDFGVAVSVTGQTSMVLGTTKYMAPELFAGEKVDGRADMYSLGFTTYEMLVGRAKFEEIFADVVRDKHSETLRWMKWHGNESVKAPTVKEVNPDVPEALSDIVEKMMAKDADERFENMEALGRAIKRNFSPARTGRRGEPGAEKLARMGRRAAAGVAASMSSVERDEADELEVSEGPETVPLPKGPMSRRMRLTLIGVAAGVVLVIAAVGIGIGLVARGREEERRSMAANMYEAAMVYYDAEDHKKALATFEELRAKYRGTVPSAQASVMQYLCRAHVAVNEGNWDAAAREEQDVRSQIRLVQEQKGDELDEWTRERREEVDAFSRYRTSTQAFRVAMTKARAAMDEARFDDALAILAAALGTSAVTLTDEQNSEYTAFLSEVDLAQIRTEILGLVAQGDDLASKGRHAEASLSYQEALDGLKGERGSILPKEERDKLIEDLENKVKGAGEDQRFAATLKAYQDAKEKSDKAAMRKYLSQLIRFRNRDVSQYRREYDVLLADQQVDAATQYIQKGDLTRARAALQKALGYDPENKRAKSLVTELDRTQERGTLVTAAEAAFRDRKWSEALAMFGKAAALGADDNVKAKIRDCQFQIELAKADAFGEAKEWDKAKAAYERARAIKPEEDPLIKARLSTLVNRQNYEEMIEQGTKALTDGAWDKARDFFRKAKAIIPDEEADDLIRQTTYKEYVAKGKDAMARGDARGALGYFNIAKDRMDTEEVRGLIEQAEGMLNKSS